MQQRIALKQLFSSLELESPEGTIDSAPISN